MDTLAESLVDADDATAEAVAALERCRDALQRAYDATSARGLSLDLGALVGRVERMALELARARRAVAPHAAAARAECCECVG